MEWTRVRMSSGKSTGDGRSTTLETGRRGLQSTADGGVGSTADRTSAVLRTPTLCQIADSGSVRAVGRAGGYTTGTRPSFRVRRFHRCHVLRSLCLLKSEPCCSRCSHRDKQALHYRPPADPVTLPSTTTAEE